jgi:ribosomal protein S8
MKNLGKAVRKHMKKEGYIEDIKEKSIKESNFDVENRDADTAEEGLKRGDDPDREERIKKL